MQVLRTIFFLLVLGNLLLFAWGQGYLGSAAEGGESERLSAQIDPGKLRIAGKAPPAAQPSESCHALTGLEREAAVRLAELLTGRDARLKIEQRSIEEPKSWWVHVPPQANGAQADKKAAEISKLGIKDFYVVRENGPNQFAISLGLFKSEEGAREYLATLQKKGVKSARSLTRTAEGNRMILEARGSAEQLARALADLPPEFAGLAAAACPATKP